MSYEVAVSAQGADGRFVGEMRQLALTDQFQTLRDEMYEPDKGAWLSARFILRRTGDSEVSFNYDEDPNWTPELHPMMFVRDLEAYPRADGHIPPWLRRLVDQGYELERQHEAAQDDQ
ncbi:immunity protein YezG family protein [Nocardia sp. CDC160]|uniref:immunity protein YezG family protein n=1 Tax=Nocardia sp. CDC160 TaxID=3112166 RepID=UPI002DB76A99|nr:immunity protein YezG family protein [Nocardia sp. CDC160]MEC3913308.1 immunity protein YezG family protein [Nocardia sp. CDC160]